jgi:hypothetical protein
MYGRLIDDICKQLKVSVAFLSADDAPVFFPSVVNERFPTLAISQSFDAARRKWLSQWNPDAVLVMDRWDGYTLTPCEFNRKLRELMVEITPHTRNVFLFSQVPVLRVGNTLNLREYVTWCVRMTGVLPRIAPDSRQRLRTYSAGAIAALAHDFPTVHLVRVEQLFSLADGGVRYSDGRNFLYADDNHLSDAGAELARGIFTRAIAGATNARKEAPR